MTMCCTFLERKNVRKIFNKGEVPMKLKQYTAALAAAMLLAAMPMAAYADNDTTQENTTETAASAETEEAQNSETEKPKKKTTEDGLYNYGYDEDGNIRLLDFNMRGQQGEVIIPSEIEGKPVVYIGNACFLEIYGITSAVIPKTVKNVGESIFYGCTSLEKITVEEGNPYFTATEDGVLMGDGGRFIVCYPPGRKAESYTIPDGVDEIAPGCFAYAQHLKTVTIPNTVGYIDNLAFSRSGIERIAIPDSVVQIDDYAFSYCENLSEVNLGKGVESIYHAAFAFCPKLTEIKLPDSLLLIGQYAFCGTGMKSVTIPSSVETINFCAFGYDEDLSPISDFVIYGEPYSAAQMYCSASDSENEYENNFTFINVKNPDSTVENAESEEEGTEPQKTTMGDPEKTRNIVIAACGTVLAAVLAVAGVLFFRSRKKKEQGEENEK